ncbi:MAG TPA: hypothetical protein DCR93_05940 [Cytophagales bacterium]|nr:hypothetical protein [Cytophagales bacterium]HAP59052.1 hypothetical protein [Cytophagales bacterium]
MAFPKKGLRKIVVYGQKFGYRVTGNDGFISFSIGLLRKNGQILTGTFSYHENLVKNFDITGKPKSWQVFQRIKATPDTIRQVIEYGLGQGWDPHTKTGEFSLGKVDDNILLNLNKEIVFPELTLNQVALCFAKVGTGHVLTVAKAPFRGVGEVYQVFDSLSLAMDFAREQVKAHPEIECWISSEKDKATYYVSAQEEKSLE